MVWGLVCAGGLQHAAPFFYAFKLLFDCPSAMHAVWGSHGRELDAVVHANKLMCMLLL
jgi:hypothetical protein